MGSVEWQLKVKRVGSCIKQSIMFESGFRVALDLVKIASKF